MKRLSKKIISQKLFCITVALLILSPLFLSDYRMSLLAKFMCFAIVAMGIDLMWGYTGILSLGQGVFFGLGAYCMGMYLKLENTTSALPDFMSWSGLDTLPWFWKPFNNPVFAIIMAIVIPATVALLLGLLTFKNRIKGVYFSIFSQALSIIFVTLFIGQQAYTGGTNGITNVRTVFGFSRTSATTQTVIYYITLVILVLIFILCKYLTRSHFGKALIAVRDGENRLRYIGHNPDNYKIIVYSLGGAIAGIAGALFMLIVGMISPAEMAIIPSIEMVIWVAIGGRGTLIGAVVGAILVNLFKTNISESYPEIWTYFQGLLFVIVVVFLPRGLVGLIDDGKQKLKKLFKKKEVVEEKELVVEE